MVFKGRHSRKFLLTRGRGSATTRPDFSPLYQTHARKRKGGTLRNAKAWKKLDCPRLRAFPPFRESSHRFRRGTGFLLVSAVTRSLRPFCSFRAAIFLSSRDCSFTHRVSNQLQKNIRVRGGIAPAENRRAMKRMSRPTLYRY